MRLDRFVWASAGGVLVIVTFVRCASDWTWFAASGATSSGAGRSAGLSAPAPDPVPVVPMPADTEHAERDDSDVGTTVTLEIRFAAADDQVEWRGPIKVTNGRLQRAYRWPRNDRSRGGGEHFLIRRGGRARNLVVPALYITVASRPETIIELAPAQGPIRFEPDKIRADRATRFLDGRVEVRRIGTSIRLARSPLEEDFPAAARGPDGMIHVVYVAYQHGTSIDTQAVLTGDFSTLVTKGHGDQLFYATFDGQRWSEPMAVTAGGLDIHRPAVAVGADGQTWVTWSQNVGDRWDLYQRRLPAGGDATSEIKRLTDHQGADVGVVSTVDAEGTVWWAWQSWRDGNFEILVANRAADRGEPINLSNTAGNEWNPAIVADAKGHVYVAWDSYDRGHYDVMLRRIADRKPGPLIPVAATPQFEARASLAVDAEDRVWIAYERAGVNWGKDFAYPEGSVTYLNRAEPLYLNRTVAVACYADGRIRQPAGRLADAWTPRYLRSKSSPRIGMGGDGRVWLAFRTHPLAGGGGENWASLVTHYQGARWSPAQTVPDSDGLIDNRPVILAGADGGAIMIHSSDRRFSGRRRADRNAELYATRLVADGAPGATALSSPTDSPRVAVRTIHTDEPADVQRLRTARVSVGDKTYRLLRGEFHRHTEHSSHRDQDGSLEDMFRYALDAASMDWIGNGDHDNGGGREYDWWIIQKMTSLYHQPGAFFPVFSYERSNLFPNGHRNVVFTRRGIRPLPRAALTGTAKAGTPDTKLLYRYLRHFGGICASHTSGTNMGTDWRDNDPRLEPVVEIYQGRRHSYEHFGAPRSATAATHIGGYQPAGYVWNALARGIRFGFQSSSDHVSTHMSYAIVLAEQPTREAVVEAFIARRCYAATDNILLDVRSGDHVMGEAFTIADRVTLNIAAVGTTPIRRLDIIRDNAIVYSTSPDRAEVRMTYSDRHQAAGTTSYYYVRLVQTDGNLAWSSPMWIHYAP